MVKYLKIGGHFSDSMDHNSCTTWDQGLILFGLVGQGTPYSVPITKTPPINWELISYGIYVPPLYWYSSKVAFFCNGKPTWVGVIDLLVRGPVALPCARPLLFWSPCIGVKLQMFMFSPIFHRSAGVHHLSKFAVNHQWFWLWSWNSVGRLGGLPSIASKFNPPLPIVRYQ